ncbi:hypothetical protein C8A01DRAFT_16167 [Parachaetomium inaequale]|uniref:Uncharacterized protein n=1 Tax=Parachaetomium inaequale TaxID=2588326 RepID=A0AAN6PFS2_9PEZI|nr:hypothetical protein C8A01DRAFT_16167 [Parachaetomium inaequale]
MSAPPLPGPPPPPPPPPPFPILTSTPRSSNPQHDPNNPQTGKNPPPPQTTAIDLGIPSSPPHADSVLVSLLMHNGWPFADHWEYFFVSPDDPEKGVVVLAAGDVRGGFWLEVKRGWHFDSLELQGRVRMVRLGWVAGEGVFEGERDGEVLVEGVPRCEFERILFKVPAPEKTLRAVDSNQGEPGKRTRITQRNCQTWVVESAEQLVREGIFEQRVVDYLRATSIMT